jgi:hypothetical protein
MVSSRQDLKVVGFGLGFRISIEKYFSNDIPEYLIYLIIFEWILLLIRSWIYLRDLRMTSKASRELSKYSGTNNDDKASDYEIVKQFFTI